MKKKSIERPLGGLPGLHLFFIKVQIGKNVDNIFIIGKIELILGVALLAPRYFHAEPRGQSPLPIFLSADDF
jgi:hypothetical protein